MANGVHEAARHHRPAPDPPRGRLPAAVIAEPVISAGGVIMPSPGDFPRLKELCAARGMPLILDEAQTGMGRLGANFAFEQDGAAPDRLPPGDRLRPRHPRSGDRRVSVASASL